MKYRKDVTDAEVDAAYRHIFKTEIEGFLAPRVIVGTNNAEKASKGKAGPEVSKRNLQPSDEEKQLLESIFERPNLPITKRASVLGLSPYMMNKMKKSIQQKGLAEQFSINLGKDFGGNISLLALTDNGYRAINRRQMTKRLQNESLEHYWWKQNIHQAYKKRGIPSEIEKSIGGKRADVGIEWEGKNIAIEVELTPKNALQNIIQDLECGFDKVLSCSKNKAIEQAIIRQFSSLNDYGRMKDSVSFRQLSDFEFVKEILRS